MFEYNNELFICQSDDGLVQRVFKIVKGSNTLIPITIDNNPTRTTYTTLITNATLLQTYNKRSRQLLKFGATDANQVFYVSYNGDLVFNPLNNNGSRFKYNSGNFEKIYAHGSSKSLVKKLCDNTYYSVAGNYNNITLSSNTNIYSDLFKNYTVSIPTGDTQLRTK